jgi:hypothetical protein
MWVALRGLPGSRAAWYAAAGRATFEMPSTGIDNTPAAAGADHMTNRKAVPNANLVGASKVITASAHD